MPRDNRSNDADGWIACDDGLHLIQMDKNLSHYGWVFRKVDGGLPYSVREATSHEMAHAQARQHLRIGVAQIAGQAPAPKPIPEPASYPPCDYCGTVPSYHPWHGSGLLNGVENRHIHACDGCRGQLPSHLGQPHPEPIAWIVGTAFWWTKEEAERDAAATGLPTVGVGPMTGIAPAEQRQGEPVALPARLPQRLPRGRNLPKGYAEAWNACLTEVEKLGPLYTHADPNVRWESVAGEQMRVIEQLKAELGEAKGEYDRSANKVAAMVAQLAERDTLLREVLEAFKLEADGSCINPGRDFIRPWAAKLAALSSSAEPSAPADRAEVNEALLWLDDFVARCNGDDRGSCSAVETLRAALGSKS